MVCSFSTDRALAVLTWNEEIERFTGRTSSSVLGRKYYDILPRIMVDDRDAISISFERNNVTVLKSYLFPCFFGGMTADICIKPEETSDGVTSAAVVITPDSTCSVARDLQKSQQLIDIGKTASALAHGVRSPLNAIKGAVVYLSEKYAQEPALIEFMTIMKEEISRLDGFITKFLSTSLSGAGSVLTDINAVLKRIEVYTSLQSRAGNVTTSFEYGKVRPVMINAFQLEQAILNVINNAFEAMRSGGRLTVKTHQRRLSEGDVLLIEVTDTGPGIAEGRMGCLESPMTSEKEGKGFGLFITREILQHYGGRLEISSRRSSGTRVRMYLPIEKKRSAR